MKRYLEQYIKKDLDTKIVLLAGPRQVGKTYLSKQLFPAGETIYLNYDNEGHRRIIMDQSWPRDANLVIFDELHKRKNWKRWIKGIYDVEGVRPRLLVSGSARLDTWRKGGDSLAGRHFMVRLHPISLKEAQSELNMSAPEALKKILKVGAFPEPFLNDSETYAQRWRRSHLERIIKEDLLDIEKVSDIKSLETLVQILSERVGSPISMSSIARDLEVSPHTVKRWIGILESLFVIFIVRPWTAKLSKAILKEPKIYFFDTGRVRGDETQKWENTVACHLLKLTHFRQDVRGDDCDLNFARDKSKREVDFVLSKNRKVETLIEVKVSSEEIAQLAYFTEKLKPKQSIQLLLNTKTPNKQYKNILVKEGSSWLAGLEA